MNALPTFDDDLHQLQSLVKLYTDRKMARVCDPALDIELERTAIAIAQLVAAKARLQTNNVIKLNTELGL
jgi:hypothetical protein